MAPRKTAGSKAAGKRRRVQSDDSEVEVLETVPVSPRKKKVNSKAVPASEEAAYNMLAEPDFSAELDAMLQVTASDENASAAPLSVVNTPRPRPVRSRTKTEKAKVLAEATVVEKIATPPGIGGIDSDNEFPGEHVLPIYPKHVAKSTNSVSAPTAAAISVNHLQLAESLCNEVAIESDGTERAGGQVDGYSSAVSIGDGESASERSVSAEPFDVKQNTIMLQSTEPVMIRDIQHPKLYQIYDGLPVLNHFCDVVLFGGRPNVTVERADFGEVIRGLPKQTILIILCALTFTRYEFFVNTALPIYDGRGRTSSPFKFTGNDFDRLTEMPLYKKGREDLPVDAIVSVGYTLNTYTGHYNGVESENLSVNVQFVILLAIKAT
ncbi:hypothetical protein BD779DRAFT_1678171 [Infundibulicybe gibba]|nr:hypothetical protein BD779DRAFT_1678171 [Infundibulicybe gibba]